MKFSQGVWKWAEGITPSCVRTVTEYRIERDQLWIAAVDRDGIDPSDRFEGTVLQLHVTSPMPDVIRVRIVHHVPNPRSAVKPDLDYTLAAAHVRIEDLKDELLFTSGRLALRINKGKWSFQFEDGSTVITSGAHQSLARITDNSGGHWLMHR